MNIRILEIASTQPKNVAYYGAMRHALGLVLVVGFAVGANCAPLAVRLHSTLASPVMVGTPVGLIARTENAAARGTLVFRYSVSVNGGAFRVVRDFSQNRGFAWTPELMEHSAVVRVTARQNESKAVAEDEARFELVSRVKGQPAVVTRTSHPLVALFSGAPCAAGNKFRVSFRAMGEQAVSLTPEQGCDGRLSHNVYVAGMRPSTAYQMRMEIVGAGGVKAGPWMAFDTGMLDGDFAPVAKVAERKAGSADPEPVLVYSSRRPFATDLEGRMIWYLPAAEFMTRMVAGGRILTLAEGMNSVNTMRRLQLLREWDLAGNLLRETNVGIVAEQLESRGIHSDCKTGGKECVSGFHHEAIRLPNGHTLVVAGLERMMPAGTQGSKEAVDVLGDLVIDLDGEFQVTGVWNSFDHLDLTRASVYNAKCRLGPGGGGCPPIFLANQANGWTHTNSLNYVPSTGDFVISMPEQNWVLKVDWKEGRGSGKVLWRLGKDGDFTVQSSDPDPWFSYQHDAGFEPVGSANLTVLDDGHTRHAKDPNATNRGQMWRLDEEKMTATLVCNADLGIYSGSVGSAQLLKNGGYSFVAGNPSNGAGGRTVETDGEGRTVFAVDVVGGSTYRTYRVANLYSSPVK